MKNLKILVNVIYLVILIIGIFIIIFNVDRSERAIWVLIIGSILIIVQRLTLHLSKSK